MQSSPVKIEKAAWGGWDNSYRISNGEADLIVTGDIGPRVMRYGFVGGQNFFKVFEDQSGKSGETLWQLRGGHRVWLAPEDRTLSYAPDNGPVEIVVADGVLTATGTVEPLTGLQKQLILRLSEQGTGVEVVHRIKNTLPFPVTLAPWALSMMAPGGIAITGFPPRGRHEDILRPTNPLVMWAFTDLRDPRWTMLEKYLVLRHDPAAKNPQKLGHFNENTWGAYLLNGEAFMKRYRADPSRLYPDMGCSYETFANAEMLEIETLGPVTSAASGGWVEHTETWSLHRGVPVPAMTDSGVESAITPLLAG